MTPPARDETLEQLVNQKLFQQNWHESLELAKQMRFPKKDYILNKIMDLCKDPEVQLTAIDKMSDQVKDKVLGAFVNQKLAQENYKEAFELTKKIPSYVKKDSYLNQIVEKCSNHEIQDAAINDMHSAAAKDRALIFVINQRLKDNDCQSAFKIAKISRDHFQKIFLECNDNDIRDQIIASWNSKYRLSDECMSNCISEKIKSYGIKEKIVQINDRPITAEEDNCIQTCAIKLTNRKIEKNLQKHLTERHSA